MFRSANIYDPPPFTGDTSADVFLAEAGLTEAAADDTDLLSLGLRLAASSGDVSFLNADDTERQADLLRNSGRKNVRHAKGVGLGRAFASAVDKAKKEYWETKIGTVEDDLKILEDTMKDLTAGITEAKVAIASLTAGIAAEKHDGRGVCPFSSSESWEWDAKTCSYKYGLGFRLHTCAECRMSPQFGAVDPDDGKWYCRSCWQKYLPGAAVPMDPAVAPQSQSLFAIWGLHAMRLCA